MSELSSEAKQIYERMQDEESRKLFECRYAYYKDGDYKHLWEELELHYKYHPSGFSRWIKNYRGEDVVAFGAGFNARLLLQLFNKYGIKLKAICDSAKAKQGEEFFGLTIISPEKLVSDYKDARIIITTLYEYVSREIEEYLKANNCENILFFMKNNEKQYFPHFIKPLKNEVIIDGGSLDGETIIDFYKFASGAEKIKAYAFEPEPKCCADTKTNLTKHNINAEIIQAGLWDRKDTLKFESNFAVRGGSRITDSGNQEINVVSLDELITVDECVTFVKMDIEGAELNALKGAKKTISRDKPRLAICVYHKREDIIEIPKFILSVNPDYKLYLRHHSPVVELETVLYALPE